jgi:hypothetical protein
MKNFIKIFFGLISFILVKDVTAQNTYFICMTDTSYSYFGNIEDNTVNSTYANNQSCSLLINPVCAGSITLSFNQFKTEFGKDFVSVYDGNATSGILLLHHSGNTLPSPVVANSGQMLVVFESDASFVDSGFIAHWETTHAPTTIPNICYPAGIQTCCGINFDYLKVYQSGNPLNGFEVHPNGCDYADYGCQFITDIYVDSIYNFDFLTGLTYTDTIKIWIDLNIDNLIEDSELIYQTTNATFTGTFMIPLSAIPISTLDHMRRMRVMIDFIGDPYLHPCVSPPLGQVLDFAVIIGDGATANVMSNNYLSTKIFYDEQQHLIRIKTASNFSENYTVNLFDLNGRLLKKESNIDQMHFDFTPGVYFINMISESQNFLNKKIIITN